MQRSRKLLASSLILVAVGLRFAAEVQAQPAPPAAPTPPPAAPPASDAGAPTPPPGDAVPPTPPAPEAPPETAPAAPESTPVPAPEAEVSTGGGLFESSQTDTGAAASAGAAAGATSGFDLGGYVRGDAFVGKATPGDHAEMKAAYGELSLKVTTPKETYGDAFAEARIRYGLMDVDQSVVLDLREAYVNAYVGPLDLRLGKQVIVWGRADAFNPTNNTSALDFRMHSPVEDDRRIGNVALRAFLNFEPFRLEGIWQPLYVATELPGGIVPDLVTLSGPDPEPRLDKGLGAARVHLEVPAFEASVSYLYGYAPLPGFALEGFRSGEDPEVFVSRNPYTHHVVGADFSTAFGEAFALRGEAAYRHPVDWEDTFWAPRPDLQYVAGVDRTFGSVNVIAQYMGRYVFDWELVPDSPDPINEDALVTIGPDPSPIAIAETNARINSQLAPTNQILFSQRHEVQHLATLRIEWLLLHDTLSLSALGMMNFTTEEALLFPKLMYKMSDALSTSIGGEIYSGPERTLFGLIEAELSAGYAELRYAF
ncbi:MAG TPA: DUF1302 family protein [Polyangiaceae bacterium]